MPALIYQRTCRRPVIRELGFAVLLLFSLGWTRAEDWPQWRGPHLNGSAGETNLPVVWSRTENVAWSTPLPGRSGATPIVSNDRVFLPSPNAAGELRLLCVNATDGTVRWDRKVADGDRTVGKNNLASCSAVTDGQQVYALFGTGDFAAFDLDGREVWHRKLGDEFGAFANMFLYGASPLLLEGRLYVPILQRNPPTYTHAQDGRPERQSWLVCLDPATGRTLWKQERRTDAEEESMEAYATPIPCPTTLGTEIVLVGANCITAHRPESGAEVWRFPGLNARKNPGGRIVPSPVAMPGLVLACGPKREVLIALRTDGTGTLGEDAVAWRSTDYVPDVCTPLYYQDRLFVLDGDRQVLTRYLPATGQRLWQGRLGVREIFSASPTGADGRIYCLSESGTVVIVSPGETFQILATIPMGEGPCASSIVAARSCLFIRTARTLYCIQKRP
jgi:outer membrane protein assembly factor BamB